MPVKRLLSFLWFADRWIARIWLVWGSLAIFLGLRLFWKVLTGTAPVAQTRTVWHVALAISACTICVLMGVFIWSLPTIRESARFKTRRN
jgi:hypothetical protein